MQKLIQSLLQNLFIYSFIGGGIILLNGLYPQLGLSLSIPQYTTISVTITTGLIYGSIEPINSNLYYNSGIYWTNNTLQPIMVSTIGSNQYQIYGDLIAGMTGIINPPSINETYHILNLTPGDGIKNIISEHISLDPLNSGNIMMVPGLQFGLDTTPPSLPLAINGPLGLVSSNDTLTFTRNTGFDGGSGIKKYIIQLSQNSYFSTAIEFTQYGNTLQLSTNSLIQAQRYWRLGIEDHVGNIIFNSPSSFYYNISSSGGGNNIISTINNQVAQTPISDQCNGPDLSNNFFDGICTTLISFPELVIVSPEHQAPDTRPIINKITEWFKNEPLKTYVFPAYETPNAYTIYEYPEELLYNNIYESEDRKDNSGKPIIIYNPHLGVAKKTKTDTNEHSIAGINDNNFGNNYNYLYLWYQINSNSCAGVVKYCPIEPLCLDTKTLCYELLECRSLNIGNRINL